MTQTQIKRVLIANRGEIAVRIIRACRSLGIETVAVYSEADRDALHVNMADFAHCLGPAAASESYLRVDKVLAAAKSTGADAIHPGYGFLSENAAFSRSVSEAGLIFIGPGPEVIEGMGSKTRARAIMTDAGVAVVPGFDEKGATLEDLKVAADGIGYPVLVKASAGGGGKGMRLVERSEDLIEAAESCQREAKKAFSDDRIFVEKYITSPRHIEIQILADHHGNVVHLFERECSIQRRHQKVVEESPSIAMTPKLREEMGQAAILAAQAVGYQNAGTVEFILDPSGSFYFLEMNTRLQVEHPVTELVTGQDLVALQLRIAQGEALPFAQGDLSQKGHAIEVRIYAEDPAQGFMPATGDILTLSEPTGPGVRVDSALVQGGTVGIHYDPMLAKLICWGPDRDAAAKRLAQALDDFVVLGVTNNVPFLRDVISHPAFFAGDTTTDFIPKHMADWQPAGGAITSEELALIATAERLIGSENRSVELGMGLGKPSTPWGRLGQWRMGGEG